ncbi:hypothetical protein A3224_03660 [Microbulbifer thermotolerans]|uniref:Uncharacterized protein n=1 Tax=Microbulbifer thermotolerans TaxID=252514 RepID=A0A143HJX0_MICTH|nr:hypothetical protein A3224_03660 [Microbulbifer thermotolerans]
MDHLSNKLLLAQAKAETARKIHVIAEAECRFSRRSQFPGANQPALRRNPAWRWEQRQRKSV